MIKKFNLTSQPLESLNVKNYVINHQAGGYVAFEGWVRQFNEGKEVTHLEYEVYHQLAENQVTKIVQEVEKKFSILQVCIFHRFGRIELGEMAIWIGVSSIHRRQAFLACQYLIDNIKNRVAIWKNEYYKDGTSQWVACHQCQQKVKR